jgi:hypothetical protein
VQVHALFIKRKTDSLLNGLPLAVAKPLAFIWAAIADKDSSALSGWFLIMASMALARLVFGLASALVLNGGG